VDVRRTENVTLGIRFPPSFWHPKQGATTERRDLSGW